MTDPQSLNDRELARAILAAEEQSGAQAKKLRQLKDEYLHRKRETIAQAYAAKGGQFGVVHIAEDGFQIDVTTTARVEWDQQKLQKLERTIVTEWGYPDSDGFIDRKLSVKESNYKAWPSDLRAKFEPARTVKASAPSLSITPIEEE